MAMDLPAYKDTPLFDRLRNIEDPAIPAKPYVGLRTPVLIAAKVIGKSYTSPPSYDVLIGDVVVKGIPEAHITHVAKEPPEESKAP